MRLAAILSLVCVCLASGAAFSCAQVPPAQRIRERLPLRPPLEDVPLFAGIDLLDHVPFTLRNRPPHDDTFRVELDGDAVVRTVRWKDSGFEILFVCVVGQRDADSAAAQLPTVLAELGFDASDLALDAEGPGHAAVSHLRQRNRLVAWIRGNVCVAIRQSGEVRYDLRELSLSIDAAIREQPPLTDGAFPHLREVVSPGSLDKLKIGAHVQFTLKPEGERGFLPAGWRIRELNRSFSTWLHVDRMTLAIQATRAGSFSITLWVSNKRQLATLVSARFTVVE